MEKVMAGALVVIAINLTILNFRILIAKGDQGERGYQGMPGPAGPRGE